MTNPSLPRRPVSASTPLLERMSRMAFSAAERRIVAYLLSVAEHDIAALTSAVLARRTGSSRSTIDRLAKRFGFAGLKDFRLTLLQESRAMQAAIAVGPSPAPALAVGDSMGEVAYKVFHTASVRALRFAEVLSRTPDLDALVAGIRAAPHVQVFGAGASAVVALDLYQRLLRLGVAINFAEDQHNQIAFAALARPGDVAIAISYSGRTKSTLQAATIAKAHGAMVAAVLGVNGSPLERLSDFRIVTPPGISLHGADAVMTRILELMFNEALFHCLLLQDPTMLDNVTRIERALAPERVVR